MPRRATSAVERPTHRNTTWDLARDEVSAHKWVDLSQRDYGVALLNDSKYGHKIKGHTLDLNLENAATPVLGAGAEWGLGFKITSDLGASLMPGSIGMYGWSGIYGTFFWVDPKERMIGVLMVQRYPGPPAAAPFQSLTYQAITRMK